MNTRDKTEQMIRDVGTAVSRDVSMIFTHLPSFSIHMGDVAKYLSRSIINVKIAESMDLAKTDLDKEGHVPDAEDVAIVKATQAGLNKLAASALIELRDAADRAAKIYQNRSEA